MEISLLKVLLDNISSFFHMSSNDYLDHEPALKYYQQIEDVLELVKPVLNALLNADKTYEEPFMKTFAELDHTIKELRELFGSWHPLRSKINFVLQLEPLISKVQASSVGVLELLISSDQDLPVEFTTPSLEIYAQKIKQFNVEDISAIITEAINEQEDGSSLSSETLAKFADYLSLRSNQELLIEAVALERLKENAEQAEKNSEAEYIDQIIAVVTCMHERLFMIKQTQISNHVPLPADFCCPLSLELMTDPVIVHSGQTYERAFIRKWIDLGLTVCPKTRQALAHTNLIPNYTVKALIANWCESNNVKLPDPVKAVNLNLLPCSPERNVVCNRSRSPASVRSMGSPANGLLSSGEIHPENLPVRSRSVSEVPVALLGGVEDRRSNSGEQALELGSQSPTSQSTDRSSESGELSTTGHARSASASGPLPTPAENSETSGELTSAPQNTDRFGPRLDTGKRVQMMWRRPSDRFGPRIVSSPAVESRTDLSGIEAQVKELVEEGLKSDSIESQTKATHELRLLAKHNTDNRIVIASCGAIPLLVGLLRSPEKPIQENSVTALLNLSINDNNKMAIASDEAIGSLIHVLETGSPEAKENSAATLFSLSVVEDNKVRIGRSGAIKSLVNLLGHGTSRGKKDAATALFNLSLFHENKGRIVHAGAVKYLVDLMDPATGMVDKAVAVLANLSTIQEGRTAIGQEGGIPVLVEVVELGSARGKENAAASLLQLCTNSNRFCNMVLQEGAVPPLVALSQTGTPRAKEKAQALLSYFRNQRHGNGGRG